MDPTHAVNLKKEHPLFSVMPSTKICLEKEDFEKVKHPSLVTDEALMINAGNLFNFDFPNRASGVG